MVVRETFAARSNPLRSQYDGDQRCDEIGERNVRGDGAIRRVDGQFRENLDLVGQSIRHERQSEGASRHNVLGYYKDRDQVVRWK